MIQSSELTASKRQAPPAWHARYVSRCARSLDWTSTRYGPLLSQFFQQTRIICVQVRTRPIRDAVLRSLPTVHS